MENSLYAWLLGGATAVISALVAISTYFIQKWIGTVDEHIKENSEEIKAIKNEVAEIKIEQKLQAKSIPETVRTELRASGSVQRENIREIEQKLVILKDIVIRKVIPTVNEAKQSLGKIIQIEDRASETDKKIESLYNTVKILVDRWKPK